MKIIKNSAEKKRAKKGTFDFKEEELYLAIEWPMTMNWTHCWLLHSGPVRILAMMAEK